MDSAPLHQRPDTKAITTIEDGKNKKYVYKPKGLNIIWGNDKFYWKINNEAAELLQVSWLEVTGTLENKLKPGKKYKISFEISIEPHAFGWEGIKIYVMAKVGKQGSYKRMPFFLKKYNTTQDGKLTIPSSKFDIEVSESADINDLTLYFGLYEVFSGVWKGGLKIYKAIVEEV